MDSNFDYEPAETRCGCGRLFLSPGALKIHQRSCSKSKRRLDKALEKAKEIWSNRKRRRLENSFASSHDGNYLQAITGPVEANIPKYPLTAQDVVAEGETSQVNTYTPVQGSPTAVEQLDDRSLAERRAPRSRQLPKRFRDILPENLPFLPPTPELSLAQQPTTLQPSLNPPQLAASNTPESFSNTSSARSLSSLVLQTFQTPRNSFGLFRKYLSNRLPSHDPEEYVDPLSDNSASVPSPSPSRQHPESETDFYPYPNKSSFLLGDWYWNGGNQKSRESFRELLNVVGDPGFRPDDVRAAQWNKIDTRLARNDFDTEDCVDEEGDGEWLDEDAGWQRTPVTISVPFAKRLTKNPGPRSFVAGELYHRSFVSVIREKIANPNDDKHFHYEPFELFWRPPGSTDDIRVHGELYTSQAFLDAHRELQESPGEPGCSLPRVVVAMMLWSDATHLTSFGNAKLWPLYLYFGNESKYRRCKPTCHLCNHVAYFQSLPDAFKDFASEHMDGKRPSDKFMAYCRREVLQAQWEILLDDDFLEAYQHGIVVECCDGITRRFYPRILTYSADYKEKIVLAGIRDLGSCPCPRCLIPRSRVPNMGKVRDMQQRKTLARVDNESRRCKIESARDIIFNKNYIVNSNAVEAILKAESLVPNTNAFSKRLSPFGFDLYAMLVVDLMHEFELGVWKALFIHLLRLLESYDKALLVELDRRFRQVPSFGRDTIRRFSANISELKRLAARDFEDILQCAIPVFEGLLPEPHNSTILKLLFTCAHWHGLAKLRMHTEQTLEILEETTILLGAKFRKFAEETCTAFDTRELKREKDARERRQQKKAKENEASKKKPLNQSATDPGSNTNRRKKIFSLRSYKHHCLGDYLYMIRQFGTSDSYSTEPGELEHRTPKARYRRTDRKNIVKQLAQIERREARLRRIRAKLSVNGCQDEPVADTPQEHHHIGISQNQYEDIGMFLRTNAGDPAINNFLPKLKQHLLARIPGIPQSQDNNTQTDGDARDATASPASILLKHNRIYGHSIMRTNYTTYDVRRSQDILNASTPQCNILVISDQDDHQGDAGDNQPFCYARVLGIYHVNVVYVGPGMVDYQPRRMEFLWVRWYQRVEATPSGWDTQKLDLVQFPPVSEEDAFGFIDPSDVLRTCHIIPAFSRGKRHTDHKGLSHLSRDASDWAAYYVNRFVDRDMMMRFHLGLGVGHHPASGAFHQHPAGTSHIDDMDVSSLRPEDNENHTSPTASEFAQADTLNVHDMDIFDPELSDDTEGVSSGSVDLGDDTDDSGVDSCSSEDDERRLEM